MVDFMGVEDSAVSTVQVSTGGRMHGSHGLWVLLAVTACGGGVASESTRGAPSGVAGSPGADASGVFIGPGEPSVPQCVYSEGWASEPAPSAWQVLIDAAGSMNDPAYPNTDSPATKWQELQRLLPRMFAALPSRLAVGVAYFNQPDAGCYAPAQAVPIGPLTPAQRASIDASVGNQTAEGATPTLDAWRFGLQQLAAFDDPEYDPHGSIVLVTGGVPSAMNDACSTTGAMSQDQYDSFVSTVESEGAAAGVRTLVIGMPGSQDPQGASYDPLFMLSRLALAGGTPEPPDCLPVSGTPNGHDVSPRGHYCHIDLTDQPASEVDWAKELGGGASCTYTLPQTGSGQSAVVDARLVYTPNDLVPRTLTKATDSSCADGEWYFAGSDDNGNPTELDICPSTCAETRANAGEGISISFCWAVSG